jgi:hypothetical protein
MASAAQMEANRSNAACSCGPKTPTGKARSSRNHLKFGLFSTQNCVRPEETQEYTKLSKALWKDLNPVGPVEEMLAVEIVRAAWRLQRCAVAEAEDGANPATQASVDRARTSTHASLRRLLNDLRQFQSDRWLRAEVLRDGFDEDYIGIADAHRVIKGLAENELLKAQFFMAPIGIDPINQTIQTQSAQKVGQALSPANLGQQPSRGREGAVPPPVPPTASAAATIRTQSLGQTLSPANPPHAKPVPPVGQASWPVSASLAPIPRNSPCPCHSGLKYKRCCGAAAPPVLSNSPAAGSF